MENYHFEIISHMVMTYMLDFIFDLNLVACPKFISPAPTIFEQRTDTQWAVREVEF